MPEPLGTDPTDGASRRAALLATKLYVPRLQPGFVPRLRLLDRLDEGLARGLTLICAPAGSGKTALLADWSRRSGRPVAWLSLDAADNDPARFWRYAIAALDRVRPRVAERVAPTLGPPAPPPSFEGVVTALVNELAARSGEVVFVLDDYHLIDSEPVHASMTFLLRHLPPDLHLVLASRSDPPLPLAGMRARGRLAELRAAELRFTADEATTLLRKTVGADLPPYAMGLLADRTEGWVTGLQLAGLSLRGRTDVDGFVGRFGGSHRYILDYLTEEVLEQQSAQVREFLLETSVLPRLNGELCDAVTGRADGQAMLESIERASLFLTPLDDVRGWWRYHPLFADMLRARLHQERPGRAPQLHRDAAAWCERHGFADDAVHHALAARDDAWAARVMERHVDELLLRSEGGTVQRWLAVLPAEVLGSRPRLSLTQARLALLSGQMGAAEAALDDAERALQGAAGPVDESYEPSAGRAASLLANVPATIALDRAYLAELRGDAERAMAFAARAKAQSGEHEWMLRSHADGYLGLAEWLHGRLDRAEGVLSSAIATWRAAGERYLAVRGCHHLGQVQRAQGRLDAALDTYRQALEIAAVPDRAVLPAAGLARVGLAEVAYQRDELDTALSHLTDGIPLCRQLVYTQPLATGLATLAALHQARGDTAAALDAMEAAERVAPSTGVTSLLNPVPAQRARLLLVQGDVSAAVRWAEDRGLGADDEPSYPLEPEHLVLARVLLAQERPDAALGLLERLAGAASAQGRLGSVIESRALQVLALAATGDDADALRTLAVTLTLACPQGHIRVFVDEGASMGALLGRLVAAQGTVGSGARDVPFECLARLQRAFAAKPTGGHADPAIADMAGMVQPLTAREREVLGLVAMGETNADIAEELVVTLDTVKKHVSHILDKLGAANRTEAVDRARRLGLIA